MIPVEMSASPEPKVRSRFSLVLTPEQSLRLERAVRAEGVSHDPAARMLRSQFSSPGYHTTLTGGDVHMTRLSLMYAVALLDTHGSADFDRALGVFEAVLDLQDRDPASRTYGIWPWFLEEPLAKMAPPDWNWADFCGSQLLEAVLTHSHRLPSSLLGRMKEAIVHAARSIERRNVDPDYTNIAIMGTFVTLVAAETYEIDDLQAYALGRLRRFFDHTRHHGAFTEYNSPNYTIVALNELQRLRRYACDAGARKMIEELYHFAWAKIADHFHAPTRQWAGPHSRSYQTFLPPSVAALIHCATSGRFPGDPGEPTIDEHRFQHECPPDLEGQFLALAEARTVRSAFLKGTPDLAGTSYLAPDFTLGSINFGDLWNQRRSLQAYWRGTGGPSSLRLRFLHDGYDFAAAQFFSIQKEGHLLSGVNFAVDGGDTHLCLDLIRDQTIRASDMRLRFELEGADIPGPLIVPESLHSLVAIRLGAIHLGLKVAFAEWGGDAGHWEGGGEAGKSWLDIVLYAGPEKEIRLDQLSSAAVAFALQLSNAEMPFSEVRNIHENAAVTLEWNDICMTLATKPSQIAELRQKFSSI